MKKITIMVLLLLTISLLFSCNQEDSNYRPTPVPKKYYLYKTDDGWRICIEGYKCVHPDPAGVQSLGELKRKLLNDEFSLAEKGSMEANLPMDEEGRYYLSDLDNLYEPYFPEQFSFRCFDSKSWCLFREGLIANLDDTLNDAKNSRDETARLLEERESKLTKASEDSKNIINKKVTTSKLHST